MMRRMMTVLATAALTLGVVAGAAGSAVAEPTKITAVQCLLGGGLPLPAADGQSLVCLGGAHNGAPVEPPALPGS